MSGISSASPLSAPGYMPFTWDPSLGTSLVVPFIELESCMIHKARVMVLSRNNMPPERGTAGSLMKGMEAIRVLVLSGCMARPFPCSGLGLHSPRETSCDIPRRVSPQGGKVPEVETSTRHQTTEPCCRSALVLPPRFQAPPTAPSLSAGWRMSDPWGATRAPFPPTLLAVPGRGDLRSS